MKAGTRTLWTFAVTSIALFMVVLDNLVVSTALPVIREELGASLEQLEWTVNAYTLTFAVFLLTGYHPDRELLADAGVRVDPETLVPAHDPETLETNVPGLFVAGAIVSGRQTGRIFIENGRFHGEAIVAAIGSRRR